MSDVKLERGGDVSRGRGRRTVIEVQVQNKWARELEDGWGRDRGRERRVYCIPVASVQSNKIWRCRHRHTNMFYTDTPLTHTGMILLSNTVCSPVTFSPC